MYKDYLKPSQSANFQSLVQLLHYEQFLINMPLFTSIEYFFVLFTTNPQLVIEFLTL
jgi:hypothetical protein